MSQDAVRQLAHIRSLRRRGEGIHQILRAYPGMARDTLIEILDGLIRHDDDLDAFNAICRARSFQKSGVPLINGRPADLVDWSAPCAR